MALRKFHKVNSLPVTKDPNAFYAVANGTNVDFYLTDSSGVEKAISTDTRINDLITAALASINAVEIVATIAARDALTLSSNAMILVLDASADNTVDSGAATYAYRHSDTSFNKIAEHESQDISITWASITDGPTSTPAQVDTTVNNSHTHTNLTLLEKITETNSEPHYNGQPLNSWNTLDW